MADPTKKTRKGLFGRTITKSTDSMGTKTRTVSKKKGNVTRVKEKVKGNALGERYKRKSKGVIVAGETPLSAPRYTAKTTKTTTGRGRNKKVNEEIYTDRKSGNTSMLFTRQRVKDASGTKIKDTRDYTTFREKTNNGYAMPQREYSVKEYGQKDTSANDAFNRGKKSVKKQYRNFSKGNR